MNKTIKRSDPIIWWKILQEISKNFFLKNAAISAKAQIYIFTSHKWNCECITR